MNPPNPPQPTSRPWLLVVVILAPLGVWLAARHKDAPPIFLATPEPIALLQETPQTTSPPQDPISPLKAAPESPKIRRTQLAHFPPGQPSLPRPTFALERLKPAWEQQIEDTIARTKGGENAARAIFALLPQLPEEALESAITQALETLPDSKYTAIALPVLLNPQTHGRVLSVLFTDLMERPDPVTLPALLQVTRATEHPFAPFALENLQLLLGEDFGTDWSKWAEGIQKLQDSPTPAPPLPTPIEPG